MSRTVRPERPASAPARGAIDSRPARPRGRALHELRLFLVALQFLTRAPVRLAHFEAGWVNESARHFPLVGAVVGALGAAVLWAAAAIWSVPVAVALSIAATVLFTGAFHEDGVADTCDGLGGAVSREKALAIMKDSRLGTYGALGLMLTLGLKASALWSLAAESVALAAGASIVAHVASRSCAVTVMAALPYAGDVELSKAPAAARASQPAALVALAWAALFALVAWLAMPAALSPSRIALALAAAGAATLVCAMRLRGRLGGSTGDGLGAVQQCSEVAAYLALAALPAARLAA